MDITVTQQFITDLQSLRENVPLEKEFFDFLYDYFTDAGMSMLLSAPDDYCLLYFDLPEAIDDIQPSNVSWLVEKEEKFLSLTMFANGNQIQTHHTFHIAKNPVNTFLLQSLKDSGTITIHFFTLMYGNMYKLKSIVFHLPKVIINQLE